MATTEKYRTTYLNPQNRYAASAAAAWAATTAYSVGDVVSNGTPTYFYRCTIAGTSGGAPGPTHTSGTAVDGTVTWQFFGSTASAVTSPAQGTLDVGFPGFAQLAAAFWNYMIQKVDIFTKHLEQSRPPAGTRWANFAENPVIVDNGGGTGRVIAWNDTPVDTILASNQRDQLAAGTLDLATDNVHYVYAYNNAGTVAMAATTTIGSMLTANRAPAARVTTSGGNITEILRLDRLPLTSDYTEEIQVGVGGNVQDLEKACILAKAMQAATSRTPRIKVIGDLTQSTSITSSELTSGLEIDFGDNTVTFTPAGHLFDISADITNFTIRGGTFLGSNGSAGAIVHFDGSGGAIDGTDIKLIGIRMSSGASQKFTHVFHSEDCNLSKVLIQDCEGQTKTAHTHITATATNAPTVERVHIVRGSGDITTGAGTTPMIYFQRSGGTIKDCSVTAFTVLTSEDDGIRFQAADECSVTECYVKDWVNSGYGIRFTTTTGVIANNRVDGSGITTPTGIFSSAGEGTISGNQITGITSPDDAIATTSGGKSVTGNSAGGGNLANISMTDTAAGNAP